MTATPNLPPPTFDEWFASENNGFTFEAIHMLDGMHIDRAMRALTVEVRNYVSHVVRTLPSSQQEHAAMQQG